MSSFTSNEPKNLNILSSMSNNITKKYTKENLLVEDKDGANLTKSKFERVNIDGLVCIPSTENG